MERIKLDEIPEEIKKLPGLVVLAFRGSVAHGTYIQPGTAYSTDDIDLIGVYVPDIKHYLGFANAKTVEKKIGEWDFVAYEFRHFVRLLCKNNPNVLTTLFLNEEHYLGRQWQFEILQRCRYLFLSKRLYHSCEGYALAQIKRMTKPPTEQSYEGTKRRELYEKFGYDCKQAAHALRLVRMCARALTSGQMFVDRTYIDADELISIKKGEWGLEIAQYHIDNAMKELEQAHIESSLPEEPDMDEIEDVLVKILVRSHDKIKIPLYSEIRCQKTGQFNQMRKAT